MREQVPNDDVVLHHRSNISLEHNDDFADGLHHPVAESQDGSKRAWLSVFGGFMIFVNIWGFTFTFGTFQSYYTLTLLAPSHTSASSISWIGTIQSFLLIVGGVMSGPFFDKGLYKIMTVTGMVLVLLGLFTLSWATEYYQIFLSQGVCCGLGGALLYVPTLALISTNFKRRRTLAMGVVTCGVGLGGVIYVAVFQQLLPRLGFPWTVRTLAFIALSVFLLSTPNLFYFQPPPPQPQSARPSTPTQPRTPKRHHQLFDPRALRSLPFQIYSISSFFIFLGYLVPFFYIPSFSDIVIVPHTRSPGNNNNNNNTSTGFWGLAVSSGTSILGRLITSYVAQRFGVMAPWIVCTAASSALCFAWIRVGGVVAFFAFCGLYGFFSGALVALPPSIFPRICKDPSRFGTWLGMGWVCSGTAFLVGSPIAGALAGIGIDSSSHGQRSGGSGDGSQQTLNFLALQLFSGASLMLGCVLLVGLWVALIRMGERRVGSGSRGTVFI